MSHLKFKGALLICKLLLHLTHGRLTHLKWRSEAGSLTIVYPGRAPLLAKTATRSHTSTAYSMWLWVYMRRGTAMRTGVPIEAAKGAYTA
eukprot:1036646-Prorocentrum_minimum.AAC.1